MGEERMRAKIVSLNQRIADLENSPNSKDSTSTSGCKGFMTHSQALDVGLIMKGVLLCLTCLGFGTLYLILRPSSQKSNQARPLNSDKVPTRAPRKVSHSNHKTTRDSQQVSQER